VIKDPEDNVSGEVCLILEATAIVSFILVTVVYYGYLCLFYNTICMYTKYMFILHFIIK